MYSSDMQTLQRKQDSSFPQVNMRFPIFLGTRASRPVFVISFWADAPTKRLLTVGENKSVGGAGAPPASRWRTLQGVAETRGTRTHYSDAGRRPLQYCLWESLGTEYLNLPIFNTGSVSTLCRPDKTPVVEYGPHPQFVTKAVESGQKTACLD